MKKSKLITGLSAAFVSAMALMSCSSLVKAKSGVILTIDGVQYTADMLFNDQKTPAAAEAKFNAVYKVAVRAYFKKNTKDNKEIARQVKVKMSEQKATAKSNADKNGTSYDVEWKKILKENGVDSTKKLQDKFEYEFQKEKFEDHFYEDNYATLRNGDLDGPSKGDFVNYFEGKQPYHMKHILVKISNLGDDNVTGTITKEESIKLYNVIHDLAEGKKTFDEISQLYSDDEAAKKDHASLGIMSRDTSFVDDFKLGTYLYESFYGDSTVNPNTTLYKASNAKNKFFGEEGTGYKEGTAGYYATRIRDYGDDSSQSIKGGIDPTSNEAIGVIPFEAALKLGDTSDGYADYEYENQQALLSQAGIKKEDLKDKYLPRNVIFNKYFNKHNIMVIAPAHLPTFTSEALSTPIYNSAIIPNTGVGAEGSFRALEDEYILTASADYYNPTTYKGFNYAAKNGDYLISSIDDKLKSAIYETGQTTPDKQHVLRDKNGRIVLVFRSGTGGSSSNDDSGYQGIHFVVIERSPFIGREYDKGEDKEDNKYYTDLDQYYTVYYPDQPGGDHPVYTKGGKDWKHTYANYIMNDPELKNKKDRADKVKTELKNCMPNLNTFIYEHLLDIGEIQFNQEMVEKYHIDIKKDIEDWISITRQDAKDEKERSWNNNWQNYCYSLEAKAVQRKEIQIGGKWQNRLVSEYCVRALTGKGEALNADQLKHMFGVGGVFHD